LVIAKLKKQVEQLKEELNLQGDPETPLTEEEITEYGVLHNVN
jgi:hypothetical protein